MIFVNTPFIFIFNINNSKIFISMDANKVMGLILYRELIVRKEWILGKFLCA